MDLATSRSLIQKLQKSVVKIRDNDIGSDKKKDGIGCIVMRVYTLSDIQSTSETHHESRRDLDGRDLGNNPDLHRYRYRYREHDLQSEQDQPYTSTKVTTATTPVVDVEVFEEYRYRR